MGWLVLPISLFRKSYAGTSSRLGYRQLTEDGFCQFSSPVTVVVGKERREFVVDPFVLEEGPFRFLLETARNDSDVKGGGRLSHQCEKKRPSSSSSPMIYVDVDAILFEHMLWLMYNDCSSLFKLNLEEIIDFYTQDY